MKKTTILVSLLAVLVLGISMTFANGPAVVIKDGWCNVPGVLDKDGNLIRFLTNNTHQVYANNTDDKNGNSKITCHATLPAGQVPPKKALHWDFSNTGIPCSTGWGITTDWKAIVTPSGNVKLTCHYKTP